MWEVKYDVLYQQVSLVLKGSIEVGFQKQNVCIRRIMERKNRDKVSESEWIKKEIEGRKGEKERTCMCECVCVCVCVCVRMRVWRAMLDICKGIKLSDGNCCELKISLCLHISVGENMPTRKLFLQSKFGCMAMFHIMRNIRM